MLGPVSYSGLQVKIPSCVTKRVFMSRTTPRSIELDKPELPIARLPTPFHIEFTLAASSHLLSEIFLRQVHNAVRREFRFG